MKQFKMKQKNKKDDFSILLGTLGNMIAGKGITRAGYGSKGKGII